MYYTYIIWVCSHKKGYEIILIMISQRITPAIDCLNKKLEIMQNYYEYIYYGFQTQPKEINA